MISVATEMYSLNECQTVVTFYGFNEFTERFVSVINFQGTSLVPLTSQALILTTLLMSRTIAPIPTVILRYPTVAVPEFFLGMV